MKKTNDYQKLNEFKLDEDKYYMICPAGVGDTFICCGLKKELEKKVSAPIHVLIKRTHETIMKLFNISDYTILDFDTKDLFAVSDASPIFTKGKIFVAHIGYHKEVKEFTVSKKFMDDWKNLFRLPNDFEFDKPTKENIKVSDDFRQKVANIAELDKIVLFVPDANACRCDNDAFWKRAADKYLKKGYKVVVNSIRSHDIKNAIFLDMSLEEALWLALNCKEVVSLRNGFTDLCVFFRNDLNVIYPKYCDFYVFNFLDLFNIRQRESICADLGADNNIHNQNTDRNFCDVKKFYLFKFIPLFSIEKRENKTKYKLFNITFLSIKRDYNCRKVRLLGVQFLKIKESTR